VLWAAAIVSCGLAVASTFGVGDLNWLRSPTSSVWVFILGVLAYFRARSPTHEAAHTRRALALVAVAAVMAMGLGATAFPTGVVLLLTPLVVVIWLMWGDWSSRASGPIDRELGNVAYGVFIGHFLSAMLMLWVAELVHRATGIFGIFGTADQELQHLSGYVASLLGGVLIYRLVERPFERLRATIRQRPAH
jgi:peptidoglycan/LPS O-acetylase OafA/YrhL